MKSRWHLLLVLATAALALGSCRELTAPTPTSQRIEVLVLDDQGKPAADQRVELKNKGYVPIADQIEWTGRTDERGILHPDIPDGTYYAIVWAGGPTPYSRWIETGIRIKEGSLALDPRTHMRLISVRLPASVEARYFDLDLRAYIDFPERTLWFEYRASIDDDGFVRVPWIEDARYSVDLSGRGSRVRLEDDLVASSDDPIEFAWEPEEMRVRLTLGGNPLPPGEFVIEALTSLSRVETRVENAGPEVSYLSAPGVGALVIRAWRPLPFISYETPFEFRVDDIPTIELGDHRIEFRFRTASGADVFGCRLRVQEANSNSSYNEEMSGPNHVLFVRSGHFRLTTTYTGFTPANIVAGIASDSTFTFVLEPEEP